jgi:hypothetical protein
MAWVSSKDAFRHSETSAGGMGGQKAGRGQKHQRYQHRQHRPPCRVSAGIPRLAIAVCSVTGTHAGPVRGPLSCFALGTADAGGTADNLRLCRPPGLSSCCPSSLRPLGKKIGQRSRQRRGGRIIRHREILMLPYFSCPGHAVISVEMSSTQTRVHVLNSWPAMDPRTRAAGLGFFVPGMVASLFTFPAAPRSPLLARAAAYRGKSKFSTNVTELITPVPGLRYCADLGSSVPAIRSQAPDAENGAVIW